MIRPLSHIDFIAFKLSEKSVMVSLSNHENVVNTICLDKLGMTSILVKRFSDSLKATYERGLF